MLSRFRILGAVVLTAVFVIVCTSTVFAAPHLNWHTNKVYYDDEGRLVLNGYFHNDGTKIIDRINEVNLEVYFRNNDTDWWLASTGRWKSISVYLAPGDIHYCNLIIRNPGKYSFDYWKITGNVNYHTADYD